MPAPAGVATMVIWSTSWARATVYEVMVLLNAGSSDPGVTVSAVREALSGVWARSSVPAGRTASAARTSASAAMRIVLRMGILPMGCDAA